MKNYVERGDTLPFTAPYALTSGDGFKVGHFFAVAKVSALIGASVVGETKGVYDLKKTANITFAVGDFVYWDDAAKSVTSVAGGNMLIGAATKAAVAADATARVRLNGVAV